MHGHLNVKKVGSAWSSEIVIAVLFMENHFHFTFFDCYMRSHVCVQHQTEQDIKSLCTENNACINFRCLEMWTYYWIWCLYGVESMILCFATAAPYYGCLHKIQQSLW